MSPRFNLQKNNFPLTRLKTKESPKATALRIDLLNSLMHELSKAKTLKLIYSLSCRKALEIFNIENCSIYLPDAEKKYLSSVFSASCSKKLEEKLEKIAFVKKQLISSDYPLAKAFRNSKTKVLTGSEVPPSIIRAGVKRSIILPMVVKVNTVGVMVLRGGYTPFSQEEIRTAQLLALHVAVRIDNLVLLENIKSEKAKLEVLRNSIRDGLALHGPDGVIYYANRAINKMFGTTVNTVGLKRRELIEHWDKFHKYRIHRYFEPSLRDKVVYQDFKPFLGALMKIESNPPRYVDGSYYPIIRGKRLVGMTAVYHDVTKEKRQAEQLALQMESVKKEKERWEAIFQVVDEGVCIINKDLRIRNMNPACQQLNGTTLDEAKGRLFYEVFQCHTKDGLYYPDFSPLDKLLITKEDIPYEEHLHTNSQGEEIWVGVSSSPILDKEGNIEEIVFVTRNISSLKEIEKAKSEFVSIASHELRTPLTVVNGYLSLLLNGDLGNFSNEISRKNLMTVLHKVSNETSRLTKLVSDLLNVSRIEESRLQLDIRKVMVGEVIDSVYKDFYTLAKQKGINLQITGRRNDGLTVLADKNKLTQILVNLVDNALKFTPSGGEVQIDYWQENQRVYIKISDTGIGIPMKLQSSIFEKFQQVPGSYLKENRGTGLGLFIVKALIDLHNGDIEVNSNPSKGTVFTFNLPGSLD